MYLITNRKLCSKKRYFEVIEECILSQIENIIIREKDLNNNDFKDLCTRIINIRKKNNTNLIINSNTYLLTKLNLDGLHLPFKLFLSLLKEDYHFDEKKILGISIHCLDEILLLESIIRCKNIKIDYIILSHIYETKCKENLMPKGLDFLRKAKEITKIKIVALGGVLPENFKDTMNYCDDIAIMSTIMESKNIKLTINDYTI